MRVLKYEDMLDDMRGRGGLDGAAAPRTLAAVLEVLGEVLSTSEADTLAEVLPRQLASALVGRRERRQPSVGELYEHVADRAEVPFGRAREQAQVACRVIAGALDQQRGRFLRERLPPDWLALFEAAEPSMNLEPPRRAPTTGSTLATGRPGSTHPLSEARPFAGAEDSVLQSENPHAGEKLSSAPGPRPGHPIAGGRPGSEVPLSEARDAVRRR